MIQVGMGEQHRTFAVHENILAARSKEFKSILANTAIDHDQKTIQLNDVDPEAFSLYVQLLYTGHIPSKPENVLDANEYTPLCKLYLIAYKLQDIAAQNATVDAMHAKSQEPFVGPDLALPRYEHIKTIYKGTKGLCAARRLFVDLYMAQAKGEWLRDGRLEYPQEFVQELVAGLMDSRSGGFGNVVKGCEQYHETSLTL
jgi:hypothetical protein